MAATKVTLTLPNELLTEVDGYVAARPGVTRSGVCADALRCWLQVQHEAEIEEYHGTLSEEERAEDTVWASLASAAAGNVRPAHVRL